MTQTRVNPSQQSTYHGLIEVASVTPSLDTARLYWVFRAGVPVRRAWNELTYTERILQNEADQRAAEVTLFNPCDWEA